MAVAAKCNTWFWTGYLAVKKAIRRGGDPVGQRSVLIMYQCTCLMVEIVWWLYERMSLFVKNTHQYLGVMDGKSCQWVTMKWLIKKKNCFTWWLQHLCRFGIVSKWKTINLKYLIHFPSRLSILVSDFLLFYLEYLDSCLLIPLDGVSIEVIDELYAPESSSKPQAGPHACLIGGIWQVDLIFLIQPPGLPPTLLAAPSQTPLLIPSCLS